MSRIGKKKRIIPADVVVNVTNGEVIVKGPKGELKQKLHPSVMVVIENNEISVQVADASDSQQRAMWGTFSSIVNNMLKGVSKGYKKQLEINGVGYKVSLKGNNLILEVGFSHPVEVVPPAFIKFFVEKNLITVEGIDKQLVGEVAAKIRKIRKPEPYKGKGIKYVDEVVRRKAGKAASAGKSAGA
jgi:large subunit ribosomal protein L6